MTLSFVYHKLFVCRFCGLIVEVTIKPLDIMKLQLLMSNNMSYIYLPLCALPKISDCFLFIFYRDNIMCLLLIKDLLTLLMHGNFRIVVPVMY